MLGTDETLFMTEIQHELDYLVRSHTTIYKYNDVKSAIMILENNTLAFKSPLFLNDPYDCTLDLITFNSPPSGYRARLIDKHNPNLTNEEKSNLLKQYEQVSDEYLANFVKNGMYENDLSKRGLSCFSKINNQILMWSHYAANHTGICVGFDLKKLYLSLREVSHPERLVINVQYVKNFEPIEYYKQPKKSIINWLRTKSISWEYEQEIRFVLYDLNFDKSGLDIKNIASSCLTSVFMGNKISEENEILLREILGRKHPNVALYKMHLSKNSFNLQPVLC